MLSLDQLLRESAAAHNAGNSEEAGRLAREALKLDSGSSQAHLVLGIISSQRGEYVQSVQHCELALAANPESIQAPLWLSTGYLKTGRKEEALFMAEMALRRSPSNALAAFQLGICHLDLGHSSEAVGIFSRVVQQAPNAAQAHHGLGCALRTEGRHHEARNAFKRAVELDSSALAYLTDLFRAAMDESDPEEAVACARRILETHPEKTEANLWLANALLEQGRPTEAEEHLERARATDTEDGTLDYLLGWTLQSLGRISEAESYFRNSIAKKPVQGVAYSGIVFNRRVNEDDRPLIQSMSGLVESEAISVREKARLYYGLGKAYEDMGEYKQAIAAFDSANATAKKLKMGSRPFDRAAYASLFDFIISTFNSEFISRFSGAGSPSRVPIFVVGMMRSGTTLVEQILSCHSSIGAAGEQLFWTRNADRAIDRYGHMNVNELRRLADTFVDRLHSIAPGRAHVIDKMPLNYAMLGLIHLAYPGTKIIHTRRSPRDTCVSIYSTPNRSRVEWAHDKDDIVFAYRQYERLMDHWRTVIPPSSLLEVQYEQLVQNQESISREMIEFCGLAWEAACLRPQDNNRVVVNPSVWQVRQPMYKTSMKRWKKYERWLGPLMELPE